MFSFYHIYYYLLLRDEHILCNDHYCDVVCLAVPTPRALVFKIIILQPLCQKQKTFIFIMTYNGTCVTMPSRLRDMFYGALHEVTRRSPFITFTGEILPPPQPLVAFLNATLSDSAPAQRGGRVARYGVR